MTEQWDFMWMRPLDVPDMLRARSYAIEGELAIEVIDPLDLAGGRFLLSATADGVDCVPTARTPDLALGTGVLGSLYLGEASAGRLAALGRIDEETSGAVARADLLFHTGRRPWNPDIF